jgi:hypothetical protein
MDEHQRLLSKSGYRDYFREDVKIPIIYSPKYNITFFGVEKLHPFDSTKYAKGKGSENIKNLFSIYLIFKTCIIIVLLFNNMILMLAFNLTNFRISFGSRKN